MINQRVETKLRRLFVPQLKILKALALSEKKHLSSREIMSFTGLDSHRFGARITPLLRHKIDGEALVSTAGRHETDGLNWQLNRKLYGQEELLELLESMGI